MTAQIFNALKTRQPEIERFMRALVETESPSGDLEGSRAVVDLLVQAASGLECVSDIKRETVPGFGEHLVIRAFEKSSDVGETNAWTVVTLPNSHVIESASAISYTFDTVTDGGRDFVRLLVTQN